MEVGAVKQAFNNEVIHLKQKLNQARIQVIHKLTRKAKTLVEKKVSDPLKEKLKRKAESAVKEVLLLKKVKPRDLAKFIVSHTGELSTYLNRPHVDLDKACARLLLHKALTDKYTHIRNTYSKVPIEDLLMSRLERRKLKKEQKEQQKNKNSKKQRIKNNSVSSNGDWDVEDVKADSKGIAVEDSDSGSDDGESGDDLSGRVDEQVDDGSDAEVDVASEAGVDDASDADVHGSSDAEVDGSSDAEVDDQKSNDDDDDSSDGSGNKANLGSDIDEPSNDQPIKETKPSLNKRETIKKPIKADNRTKLPKINKGKNKKQLEKISTKKFKKGVEDLPQGNKVVDPFFITASGDNYMSVAEPRAPDEIKEVHKQGNRQLRRAIMFGHEPKVRPKPYNRNQEDSRFGRQRFDNNDRNGRQRFDNSDRNSRQGFYSDRNGGKSFNDRSNNKFNRQGNESYSKPRNFNSKTVFDKTNDFSKNNGFKSNDVVKEKVPEKLHPSWEAKKKISSIQPYQGKKIVFDEG